MDQNVLTQAAAFERASEAPVARAGSRVAFLDNLRSGMVLLVIMGHSALAYTGFAPWWYIDDSHGLNMPLVVFFALQEVFLMPAFLFTAGYFAFPSSEKKSPRDFLVSKLRALLLPWAITILLLCPALQFVWNNHHGRAASYTDTLSGFLAAAAQFRTGYIDASGNDQFQQHHMWFISLLVVLFALFALLQSTRFRLERPAASKPLPSVVRVLVSVAILDAVWILISNLVAPSLFFFKIANVVQFQPVNILTYLTYFGLGVYAGSRGWFSSQAFPGRPWVWGVLAVVSAAIYLTVAQLKMAPGAPAVLTVPFALARATLCVSWFGWLCSSFARYMRRESPILVQFAKNSFMIYIVHMNIVVLLQTLVARTHLGQGLKYLLVFPTAVVLSYLVARRLVMPSPKLAAGVALAVSVGMVVIFH